MELDLRSVAAAQLTALETSVQRALNAALSEENARWRSPGALTMTTAGSRGARGCGDAGRLDDRTGRVAATRAVGAQSGFDGSARATRTIRPASAFAAIEIGGGGRGSDAHAPTEAFDTSDSWLGTQRALLLTIALAQK